MPALVWGILGFMAAVVLSVFLSLFVYIACAVYEGSIHV